MAKIKFDVKDVNPSDSQAWGGGGEPPKPGNYRFKVREVNPGFSKGDNGAPDKSRPRLEVIYECLDAKYKGFPVWDYISFSDGHKPKLDQFLMAVGVATERKRTGEFDPAKLAGKTVKVRIRGGKNNDGDYRAEVSSVFPDTGDDGDGSVSDDELTDDEELMDGEEIAEDEELMDDDDGEIEEEGDDRRAELEELKVDDLKPIAKGLDIKLAGHNKASLIDAILEAEAEQEDGDEEELADDDDELLEDDEELIEEDESDYLTRDQLKGMDSKELVATAKDFDIVIEKGTKKGALIDMILEAQGAPTEDDDDEVPF